MSISSHGFIPFNYCPALTLLSEDVFVVHGGLYSTVPTIAEINAIDRKREVPIGQKDPASTLMIEMLWSDPRAEAGRGT